MCQVTYYMLGTQDLVPPCPEGVCSLMGAYRQTPEQLILPDSLLSI